ncbi:MAG: hypothetical protein KDD36_02535 [Flavobacteriales bacterium]|nr:hypothetical protein [Flavobacteriales bacterium]
MKPLTSGKSLLLMAAALGMAFVSCKKERDNDYSAANDNALAERSFSDIESISDQAADGNLTSYKDGLDQSIMGKCATITHDTTTTPRSLVVDFGTVNCLCNDGRNRRGKIRVSYNGMYRDPGSTHSITPEDYYVNDYKIEGLKSVTNMGYNSSNHLYYNITVDGTVTAPDGKSATWKSDRVREWVEGESTLINWLDDVYLITGTASGTGANGNGYNAAVKTPLRVELSCRWITSGSFELTPDGKDPITGDYGNGNCDNQATVVFRGKTYNVTLK